MGLPLVPLGDGQRGSVTRGEARHTFGPVEWEIVVPTHDRLDGKSPLPSHVILDVWIGLLYQWQLAGAPESGEIRFGRYEFLHLLGWLSRRQRGGVIEKPSGRHYRQLNRAMRYLAQTTFIATSRGVQVGHDGALFRGTQGFGLVDYWRLADDQGVRAAPSVVVFTQTAQKMLRSGPLAAIDLDVFLSLPTGTPRQLLRLLTWLRAREQNVLPLAELFARLGSVQRHAVPARARQILSASHDWLCRRGILGEAPEYCRLEDGQWGVRYSFTTPDRPREDVVDLLVGGCVLLGVRPAMATYLATTSPMRLLEVLSAVLLGHLVPQRNLAGLIVRATQSAMPLPDLPNPQWMQTHSAGGRWVQDLARSRASALEVLFSRGILPERAAAHFGLTKEQLPGWVEHGLWALWAQRQLNAQPSDK